uniref:Uncharacterized protein n=1 Tax=Steinernema glaseri TaxID=37863 RepID=A0A1I7YNC6_9BILA
MVWVPEYWCPMSSEPFCSDADIQQDSNILLVQVNITGCRGHGEMAEWSKALVLGTSHIVAWVRIPLSS